MDVQTSDLTSCDREIIHLTPSIQSHGCLLAFNLRERRLEIHSENSSEFLGIPAAELTGARLEHLFDSQFVTIVSELINRHELQETGRHLSVRPKINGTLHDVFVFTSDQLLVLEFEKHIPSQNSGENEILTEQVLREYMLRSKTCATIEQLSQLLCQTIRRITGLDRVMMYRFIAPEMYGIVIGEDRITSAHSYMDHRFPASDIPAPARELYLRNTVRLIPDVHAKTVPLTPAINPMTKKPLNMSDSRLRTVSPIHIEYLKNMKVGASFSVAVTHQQKLWGLITCHHLAPTMISQSLRTACEIIAHSYSVQAPLLEEASRHQEQLEFELKLRKTLDSLRLSHQPLSDFFKQHRSIAESFHAGGIAMVSGKLDDFAGIVPLRADIEELAKYFRERFKAAGKTTMSVDSLSSINPEWERMKDYASGVLVTMVPDISETLIILFRPEYKTTITWGGDPRKTLEKRGFEGRINPRLSFEAWEENVNSRAKPWRKFEIDGLTFFRDFIFDGLAKKERMIADLSTQLRLK